MGIVDRDWYRQHAAQRRQAASRRAFPFRLALLVGLSGALLVGSILQSAPAHQFAGEIGSWWDAWRATPFPPLAASSLEDWLGANRLTNVLEIKANRPAAGGFTVVRLHEASSGALAPGIDGDAGYLAILLYRLTGNVMLAVMLVVLIVAAGAYWLWQKMRLIYGVIELCLGILVAGVAAAAEATDLVKPHLTPVIWNQDFFRLVTGIYFVVRGMTNIRDGFELRPRRDQVDNAASAGSVETAALSVTTPTGESLETPPQVG